MLRPLRLPSTILPGALAATLLATAAPVLAQTYRIVGPDGRITYSDRKPTDPGVQTSIVGHAAPAAPLFAPPADPAGSGAFTARGGGHAKQAIRPAAGGAAADVARAAPTAAGTALPAGLPEATLGVVGREDVVQSVWDTCTRTLPTSYDRYDDATRAWRKHNAAVIAKTDRILYSAFTSEQRDQIHAAALQRLQILMAPVAKADKAAKIAWCDKWAQDLTAGAPDLAGDATLATPIMGYTPP